MFYLDDTDYNLITDELQKIISNKKLTPLKLSEVKNGDQVYINFYPNSQKYIYTLYPKLGTVEKIKMYKFDNNEIPSVTIKNHKGEIEDLFHEGVSYYGDSLGYDYSIFLVE